MGNTIEATSVKQVPPRTRVPQPARLVVGEDYLLREKGLTREVAHRVAASRAKSSRKGYDGNLKSSYDDVLGMIHIDPYNPSMPQTTDFLQYAFDDLKLQYSTMIGYRAMLSSTLKHHTELDISHSHILGD